MTLWTLLRHPVGHRLFTVVVWVGSLTILGLAFWLTPEHSGHSTHMQLGLSQCSVLTFTGYPCPMCGMTTAFAWMARGAVFKALYTQPAGAVLYLCTVTFFVIATMELLRPRERWLKLWGNIVAVEGRVLFSFFAVLGAGWAYKVWLMWGSMK